MAKHESATRDMIKCKWCGLQFSIYEKVVEHIKRFHEKEMVWEMNKYGEARVGNHHNEKLDKPI